MTYIHTVITADMGVVGGVYGLVIFTPVIVMGVAGRLLLIGAGELRLIKCGVHKGGYV